MKKKLVSMLMLGLCFSMMVGCSSKPKSVDELINAGFENNDGSDIIDYYVETEDMDIIYEMEDKIVAKFDEERKAMAALTPEELKETKYADVLTLSQKDLEDNTVLKDKIGILNMIYDAPNETICIPVDDAAFKLQLTLVARTIYVEAQKAEEAKDIEEAKALYQQIVDTMVMYEIADNDVVVQLASERLAALK